MSLLRLKVVETAVETSLIRRIVLAAADGAPLPGFEPGAHITAAVPGVGRRKYSLVNVLAAPDATTAPSAYTLGVRRDDAGQGGSKWMCSLAPGAIVDVDPPANDFALAAGTAKVHLVAGGIGITPLIGKMAHLKSNGRPFQVVYAARSQSEFAFLPALRALAGDALTLHADDEAGGMLDVGALIDACGPGEPLHICGPKPMIAVALRRARALGWPEGRLRFELFYSSAAETKPSAPSQPLDVFEVVVKSTGAVVKVPPDKSILAALLDAGIDPLHDCDKGECGVCQVGVIEGVPDHRDSILSEAERAAGKVMQICVSRSKSPRLVIDL